ncbi:MAG: Choline-sulfatase [candidate division BRC1 bacterium ADurb.BinA364]|nr:MAG: Choline-sulfatase [candidate division BRC1 bacterium ADurb.BinA364]
MDRLAARGVSFWESHSANPVCCPARAAWFTGRATCENAVAMNSYPIAADMPDLGQWLGANGYETAYVGKWHVPARNQAASFNVSFPNSGQGEFGDEAVARAAEAYLHQRSGAKPFFLTVGFLQPHDICYWLQRNEHPFSRAMWPEIRDALPPLPPNFEFDPREPRVPASRQVGADWSEDHWRFYLWSYCRHVEMVDACLGQVLDALEDSGQAENTLVIFSADHGEGQACHKKVLKGYLYEQALKVPLIVSLPGGGDSGRIDRRHLVSGLDLAPTLCDFADAAPPPRMRGYSLRPLLEGRPVEWREFVVAESHIVGRAIRTADYKYIAYSDDPVDQLFDMKNDPWETRNLAAEGASAAIVEEHRRLLADWEAALEKAPLPKKAPKKRPEE